MIKIIAVLRLGHRCGRDARISTHCGLVARAFGAEKIIYSGQRDERMMNSVRKVAENFGGPFAVSYEKNWRRAIADFAGVKVHLTMYGLLIQEKISELRNRDLLIIIGGEKVPSEVYQLADYNIAVTSQPHSEVAALAVFLHECFKTKKKFKGMKKKIIPQPAGKALQIT